jgi:hypothetical protein
MKQDVIAFFSLVALALLAAPLAAWADANPDFDDDAKPILRTQPGLLQYVESRFQVKDTGTAKFPGDDDRAPGPPYIFRARPLGSSGPFNLRLLIQPGPPGHVLGVVDITKVHLSQPGAPSAPPAVASQPPPEYQPPQSEPSAQVPELAGPPQEQQQQPPPQEPAPATSGPVQQPQPPQQSPAQPTEPTADTPSGPIMGSGSQTTPSTQQSLAPPPDPAPSTH